MKIRKLVNYVKNRGLKVTMIRVFPLKYGRSVIIRLNVEAPQSNKLTEPGFWPRGVTCRPWLSKNSYMKQFRKVTDNDKCESDNTDLSGDIVHRNNNNPRRYNSRVVDKHGGRYERDDSYGKSHSDYYDYNGNDYDQYVNYGYRDDTKSNEGHAGYS